MTLKEKTEPASHEQQTSKGCCRAQDLAGQSLGLVKNEQLDTAAEADGAEEDQGCSKAGRASHQSGRLGDGQQGHSVDHLDVGGRVPGLLKVTASRRTS